MRSPASSLPKFIQRGRGLGVLRLCFWLPGRIPTFQRNGWETLGKWNIWHTLLSEKVEKHLYLMGQNTKSSTRKIGAFHVPPIILRHTHIGYSWFYIPFYPMISDFASHYIQLYSYKQTKKPGWWYTYPSETWWSSSVGMMIIPNIYIYICKK